MLYTFPHPDEFIILNRDVSYICWFYNDDSTPKCFETDTKCSVLEQATPEEQCIRFDFKRKHIYRFLNFFTTSKRIFMLRKLKLEWVSMENISSQFLLQFFLINRNDSMKYGFIPRRKRISLKMVRKDKTQKK